MRYEIRNKNVEILKFDITHAVIDSPWGSIDKQDIDNVDVISNEAALPVIIAQETSAIGVGKWLEGRKSPITRRYMDKLLPIMGVQTHEAYIIRSMGLNLTDTYWIVPEGSLLKWEDVSLYRHPFSDIVSRLALMGIVSVDARWSEIPPTPELSTNGNLPKCWRWRNGEIVLVKGHSEPASNMGREAYCEYYMAQVAEKAGLKHVPYDLVALKDQEGKEDIFSECPIFSDEQYGYEPMWSLLTPSERESKGKELLSFCAGHMDPDDLSDILVFDAVIGNTDRHLYNFGVIRNNDTGEILGPAPLFDNGMSLLNALSWHKNPQFNEFMRIDEASKNYTDPYTGSFEETVRFLGGTRQKEMLERLVDFQFTPHPTFTDCDKLLDPLGSYIREVTRLYISTISRKTKHRA